MTLSFVVKEKNCIDCKLWWSSQVTTFKPSDIKIVFPKLFNMEWNDGKELGKDEKSLNQRFLESKTMDKLIKSMKRTVDDKYFDNFYKNILEIKNSPD